MESAVARLAPRLDGAFFERFAGIGNDEIEVEVNRIAESLATRASTERIVERKEARLGLLVDGAIVLAFEALVEGEAFEGAIRVREKLENGFALALAVTDFDGVRETRAGFGADGKTIH